MTRETALRRMLAGYKVHHETMPKYYFKYDKSEQYPVLMCRKSDNVVISETAGNILPARTGWKNYEVGQR